MNMTYNITLTQSELNQLSALLNIARASMDNFATNIQQQIMQQQASPTPPANDPAE